MPEEALSMRKFREVLRLSTLGLAQHQIARSCSIVQSTVHKYLKLAQAAQLSWPLPENLSDQKLDQLLFGERPDPPSRRVHPPPDFPTIHKELQTHKDLTLELLWQEYKQANASGGYRYSRFCDLYREWARAQNLTLRQQHQPGEKMFVDYAGAGIPIHNRATGEIHQAAIFVAALGVSSYTFAEATWSQELPCWIGSHIRALEYFGGLPMLVVPDNLKTGVTKACRYEPDLNPTYSEMAAHYGVAVLPARPRKPRDKAKAENAVQVVQRWIVAALRKHTFFSLGEVNQAIGEALAPLGTDWRKEFLETAPYLIVVFRIDFGLTQTTEGETKTKHYYVQESVGIATGFLLAALHMSGLATLTHTPSPMGFLSSILERPKNERPFVVIPVGLPALEATVPAIGKRSIADVMEIK